MNSCNSHLKEIKRKNTITEELIIKEYNNDQLPWYIGYSGGKDSSTLLVLVFNALKKINYYHKKVCIIYCDTGVEIPIIRDYVYKTLSNIIIEAEKYKLPISIHFAKPNLDDFYFVKIVGRGYPPPTNKFRWCTDRLRINPIKKLIDNTNKSTILLGIRNGESNERDKVIKKHSTKNRFYQKQKSNTRVKIFCPIIDYDIRDVWSTLMYSRIPSSIDFMKILELYKDAGTESPIYREEKGIPCGKGRFGCWTCTVIRKDKSVTSMIENGYHGLKPLLEFRNWLIEMRDDSKYRASYRRNGNKGLGPLTLEARKIVLEKLMKAQNKSKINLIGRTEIARIKQLWNEDRNNPNYKE